jgi:cbb3-type cytochrome oxidase subunit 3
MAAFASIPLVAQTDVLSIVSLLFFFSLFIGILVWLVVGNRNGRFTRDARLPLMDDQTVMDDRTRSPKEHRNG